MEGAVVARGRVNDAFAFDAALWRWDARKSDAWFFVTVPPEVTEEIRARFGAHAAGFGSLKVEVTIGATTWQTSVFPESVDAYVLPVKKQVRKAEALDEGATAHVRLRITPPR